jgi:hypothetical protein
VAGKLVDLPERTLTVARRNLDQLLDTHPRGVAAEQLRRWAQLLAGPTDDLLEALVSRSPRSIELRQSSPFAGVLTERERQRVLDEFAASRRKR